MLRKHWKKLLIAAAVLVPMTAWAGMELAGVCPTSLCPFC